MSRGSRAIDIHVDAADGGPAVNRHRPAAPARFSGGRPLELVTTHRVAEPDHWHLVSYGLTELEYKETEHRSVSGWGFELTFRVAGQEEPLWAVDLLNTLAAYIWTSGHAFLPGHHIDLRGPIKLKTDTALTAAVVVADPRLDRMDGPFGAVTFLQVVGLTADELEACRAWSTDGVVSLLRREDPLLVTRLDRRSLLDDPVHRREVAAGRSGDGSALTELRVASLVVRRRFGGRVEMTLGAGAAAALGPALRRELVGMGASFEVVGDEGSVRFVVGDVAAWGWEGHRLELSLPLVEVEGLGTMFTGRVGSGRRPVWSGLRFRVVR